MEDVEELLCTADEMLTGERGDVPFAFGRYPNGFVG